MKNISAKKENLTNHKSFDKIKLTTRNEARFVGAKKQSLRRGFTMVELIIAMGAVSVLLVIIGVLVYNITRIYTKGVTIRNVNTAGRLLIDDIRRTINGSPTVAGILNLTSNLNIERVASIRTSNGEIIYYAGGTIGADGNIVAGSTADPFMAVASGTQIIPPATTARPTRFCTGLYSYVWNIPERSNNGREFTGQLHIVNRYQSNADKPVRMVKIRDLTREYCKNPSMRVDDTNPANPPTELLPEDETNIVMYDFQVFQPVTSITTGEVYYTINFVLGTLRGVEVTAGTAGRTCRAPGSDESDFDYCSINKFNMAARATGKNN